MRNIRQWTILIGVASMSLAATAALGETVTVKILNDGADEIVASVYDLNAPSRRVVLENLRIVGFAWVPVEVTRDGAGQIHLRWTAETLDASFRRCGHHNERMAPDEAVLHLSADSQC